MLLPMGLLIALIATNKDSMQQNFSKTVLHRLSISNKYLSKSSRNVIFFIALILMMIALARPVINEQERSIKQEIIPIVVAIDVSKSMLAQDLKPNRLQAAKQKLLTLIKQADQSALGVVLFAKSAYILSPITQDFSSLEYLIKNFDQGYNFDNGSNLLSALEASNRLLKNYTHKNIILLTDGGNNSEFDQEIEYAKKSNLNIYTLSLALDKPVPIPQKKGFLTDQTGNIIMIKRNDQIKSLSLQSGGGYIEYSLLNSDMNAIYNQILKQSSKEQIESKKYKEYTELFYYPLVLALVLLLFAFSSLPRKELATIFLLFFLTEGADASIFDFKHIEEGKEAYANKEYDKASNAFSKLQKTPQSQYNHANSLYKQKKYESAIKAYESIEAKDRHLNFNRQYNTGNAYAKLNQLEKAIESYEKALKIKDDKEAKENLETVKKALKQQKKSQDKKENDKEKESDQNNKQNQDQQQKDQNKKSNENKKDQKKSSSKDDQKSQSEANKESKEQKQKSHKPNNPNNPNDQKSKQQAQKVEEISDKEEAKWMKQIKNQNPNVMLKPLPSKESSKESEKPY